MERCCVDIHCDDDIREGPEYHRGTCWRFGTGLVLHVGTLLAKSFRVQRTDGNARGRHICDARRESLRFCVPFSFLQVALTPSCALTRIFQIGADDIFLTIDSFEHSKLDFLKDSKGKRLSEEHLSEPPVIKNRMILAYKTAGSVRG